MINLDKVLPKCKKCEKQIKEIEKELDLNLLCDALNKIFDVLISKYKQEKEPKIHVCECYELIKTCKISKETKLAIIVTILLMTHDTIEFIEKDLVKEVENMLTFARLVVENSGIGGVKYAC